MDPNGSEPTMTNGPQLQVTTSYRTGSAIGTSEDIFEEAIFNASSQVEFQQILRAEAEVAPQSSYDTGHAFNTVSKRLICTPIIDETLMVGADKYRYFGPMFHDRNYFTGGFESPSAVNADYYGPRAIGAVAPTNPVADLAVTLAELKREGFPLVGASLHNFLLRHRSSEVRRPQLSSTGATAGQAANTAAKESLSSQFGFLPIAGEVRNLAKVAAGYRQTLAQFQRDSGKIVRRSYKFPLERSTIEYPISNARITAASPTSAINSNFFVGNDRTGMTLRSKTTTRRIWFSGAFTYFLQQRGSLFDDAERISQEANKLLGYRLTPEVLWNLTPWSWLSDWNVNIGQNIANATALTSDGLVMKYGYLMCETTVDYSHTTYGLATKGGYNGPFTTTLRTVRKERVKASPFGFSIVPGAFTARQWWILGSLGFTKSPGVLRGE